MSSFEDYQQWYHGSPLELTVLRAGSMVTPFANVARAFSHKPSLMCFGDTPESVRHNGAEPGILYVIGEPITADDLEVLPDTADTHWQITRQLRLRRLAEVPITEPPLLSAEEVARMYEENPEWATTTGFVSRP